MYDTTLDATVTQADVDAAHDAVPHDYAAIFQAIAVRLSNGNAQDDLDELGAGPVVPATPADAIAHARALSVDSTYVGVGYCLKTVRDPEFRIPSLYPDAETSWDQAKLKHLTDDPKEFPRGSIGFATNDRHGHVWLNVGGGICLTTDYRRPGFVDYAPISAMAPWIGGKLVGWAEDLNGIDCWPFNTKGNPKPKPKPVNLDLATRLTVLHAALRDARAAGRDHRVDVVEAWIARLEAKQAHK